MLFNRRPRGRITLPKNRERVPRRFRASGTINSLPPNQHLVLVVEVGGLMWPKGDLRVQGRSWSATVQEGGTPPDGRFTLSLYLVGERGYDGLAAWLERGQSTGHYPGLEQITHGVKLHSIRLRLQSLRDSGR